MSIGKQQAANQELRSRWTRLNWLIQSQQVSVCCMKMFSDNCLWLQTAAITRGWRDPSVLMGLFLNEFVFIQG